MVLNSPSCFGGRSLVQQEVRDTECSKAGLCMSSLGNSHLPKNARFNICPGEFCCASLLLCSWLLNKFDAVLPGLPRTARFRQAQLVPDSSEINNDLISSSRGYRNSGWLRDPQPAKPGLGHLTHTTHPAESLADQGEMRRAATIPSNTS